MYAMLLRLWPPILHLLASDCIVLEPAVARFISDGGYRRPVTVIPHGIRPQTRDLHRRRAATGVLLVLGFPGWYKGTDLPVTWWEDPATRSLFPEGARLVVAGSPNPVHAGEQNYERYLTDLRHQCHRAGVTYLPEVRTRDIPRLLNTADLLVFPYRALVGGSGLFALAIQHRVPVALSAAVGDWLRAPDCAEALSKAGLEVADLIFSDAASLARLAHDARSPEFHDRIRAMMDILARGRDWSVVASRYHAVLMPPWVTAHTRP
ncbi:MAG TPA: hypothetical protein VM287_07950 [Egibacteraceae bacterium]|nr:hypothetical protein [Egibacteraceae bacterium]